MKHIKIVVAGNSCFSVSGIRCSNAAPHPGRAQAERENWLFSSRNNPMYNCIVATRPFLMRFEINPIVGWWLLKWQVRAGEGRLSWRCPHMPVRSGTDKPLATRPTASHSHSQQMVQFLLISPYNITKRGFFLGSLCLYLEKFVILMPNWESWARRVRDTTADGRPFLLCFRFIFLIFSSRCLAF